MKKIYFDNAATTPVDPKVLKAMMPFWKKEFGNPNSIHSWGQEARKAIDKAREKIAKVLGCKSREVIFTSCATESNNLALKGVVEAATGGDFEKAHIVVSPIEHHCVLDAAKHLEKLGVEVSWLKVDKFGLVDVKEIEESVKENTVLVSVMYVNNEVGTIEPIKKIGKLIKKINVSRVSHRLSPIFFHTDAVQAACYLDINVNNLGVDLLSLSAHKFHAPKGIGLLFVKEGTPLTPILDGGGQEFGFRSGTENVAFIVGMGEALEKAESRKQIAKSKVKKLQEKLIKGVLEKIPGAILTGHPKLRVPHIASFCIKGVEGEAMLLLLDEKGIAASSGSACTTGSLEPSHVLLAMGISPEIAHGSLRLSLSKYNTEEEVDYFLKVFPGIVKRLRKMSPIG